MDIKIEQSGQPERRKIKQVCPKHGGRFIYMHNSTLICCNPGGCSWSYDTKREADRIEYPDFVKAKAEFNG